MYLSIILILSAIVLVSQVDHSAFTVDPEQKPFVAPVGRDGVQRVQILAGEYFFTPKEIVLRVNVPVELLVKKASNVVPHDIVIKSPEAGMDIDENIGTEPKTIKFTPTKTGRFPFYCSKKFPFFKSHRERGMEGVIEVIP